MRIISGKYGGRRLNHFQADHIRPTTDRVKESIFNTWAPYLEGAVVLDLYSGTGNLSIEALSWGATKALAVESHKKSIEIIRKNKESLNIGSELEICSEDSFRFLKSYTGPAFDLIFIDPPFTKKIAHDSMEALAISQVWKETTKIVIESSKQERMEALYGLLECTKQKNYGDKLLSFFEPKGS